MPRMVRMVAAPRTFSGLTAAPMAWHRRSMSKRALKHADDNAGPARKVIKVVEAVGDFKVVPQNPL